MAAQPLIIDNILYNGDPIVKLRLRYLFAVVDYFYITEARETFTGKVKEQLYIERDAKFFEPYISKIVFLVIDKFPSSADAWARESYQRDYAREPIIKRFGEQKYIVLCCDVDEIPKVDVIHYALKSYSELCLPRHIALKMYQFNFNWITASPWLHPYIVNDVGFKRITLDHARSNYPEGIIWNAGWHFAYFLGYADVKRKIESFSHTEFDQERFKSDENLERSFETGIDLFHRGIASRHANADDFIDLPDGWIPFHKELQILQKKV